MPVHVSIPANTRCQPATSFVTPLYLRNTAPDSVHLTIDIAPDKYFKFLGKSRLNYALGPSDSMVVPLRFVNTWGRINGNYKLEIRLQAAGGREQLVHIPVVMEGGIEPGVYAEVMQDKMLVLPGVTAINLPVHIRSMLPENPTLFIEQQPGVQALKLASNPMAIVLPSVRDTVLSLPFLREQNRSVNNTAPIVLQVRDVSGKVWSTFNFLPQMLSSSRTLYTSATAPSGISVGTSFNSMAQGGLLQDYQFAFHPVDARAQFRTQLNYQVEGGRSIERMHNSWVQFRHNNTQVTAGSQNGFHELNLQGRGLAITQADTGEKVVASLWLVDQNPNLIASLNGTDKTERIASAQLSIRGNKGGQTLFNGSWFRRYQNPGHGQLVFGEWQAANRSRHFFSLRLGLSREQLVVTDTALHGLGSHLEWKHNGKKTQWYGMAQLATPAYAGQMRGQRQLTLQAVHAISLQQSLSLQLRAYQLQTIPKLVKVYGSSQFLLVQSADIDYTYQKNEWAWHMRSYLLQQQQTMPLLLKQTKLSSLSMRSSVGLSGKIGGLFFNSLLDGGLQRPIVEDGKQKSFLAWKSNTAVNWHSISIQASTQHGAYYLTELLEQVQTGRFFKSIMFNSSYAFNLGKKGSLQGTLLAARNSMQQGWFQSAVLQGLWRPKEKTLATAMLMYQGGVGLQGSIGLQQTFSIRKRPSNSTRLFMQIFADRNANGIKDAHEVFVPGQIVQVDDVLLITNGEGELKLNYITRGQHVIRVLSKGSASKAMVTRTVDISGKEIMLIGIPPVHIVQGKVLANKDRFTGIAEHVGGVKLMVAGADGEQVAFSREDGHFSFEAPAGEYRVFLAQQQAAASTIYIDSQQGFTGKLELIWTAGERPVQVKKVKIQ